MVVACCVSSVQAWYTHAFDHARVRRTFEDPDVDVPALALLQPLVANGWSLSSEEPAARNTSSARHIQREVTVRRKAFLKCLVAVPRLLSAGLVDLPTAECS
eukprot:7945861-Alexandrium_andersonii.AAC.1